MFVFIAIYLTTFSLFSTYSQGTQLYNAESELCCDGTVHAAPENLDHDYECCGKKVYKIPSEDDAIVSRCCGDKLYPAVNSTLFCCGTELFDEATRACHQFDRGFQTFLLSPDNIRARKTEVCGKSKDEIPVEFYNPEERECCSGVAFEKKEGMECCGGEYIDPNVSKCCLDYARDEETKGWKELASVINYSGAIPTRSACCDGRIIDVKKQECCKGVVVNLPEASSSRNYPVCCGSQLITDRKTRVCVKDERVESRENENQVFCDGKLYEISGDETLLVYCLEREVWKLTELESVCLVKGKYVKFEREKQVCGSNELIERTKEDVENQRSYACLKAGDWYISRYINPDLIYTPPSMGQKFDNEFNETFYNLD